MNLKSPQAQSLYARILQMGGGLSKEQEAEIQRLDEDVIKLYEQIKKSTRAMDQTKVKSKEDIIKLKE